MSTSAQDCASREMRALNSGLPDGAVTKRQGRSLARIDSIAATHTRTHQRPHAGNERLAEGAHEVSHLALALPEQHGSHILPHVQRGLRDGYQQ